MLIRRGFGDSDCVMSDDKKTALDQRIEEYRRKIEEISAFREDAKIDNGNDCRCG